MTHKEIKKNFPFSGHAGACMYCAYSLIDCLYHLKLKRNKVETNKEHSIIIEEMTNEEMKMIYGR